MKITYLAVISVLIISGCAGANVRQKLGLYQQAPDEFLVMPRKPLVLPSSFDLPSPSKVAVEQQSKISHEAATELFSGLAPAAGKANIKAEPLSEAEKLLLSQTETAEKPNVKEEIYSDSVAERTSNGEKSFWDRLTSSAKPRDSVIDAAAEEKRIQEAKEQGKKVTGEGVEEKKSSTRAAFESIF
jgi:hypothetical protein